MMVRSASPVPCRAALVPGRFCVVMVISPRDGAVVLSDGYGPRVVTASGRQGEHEQEGQPEDAHLEPQRVLDRGGEGPGAGPDGGLGGGDAAPQRQADGGAALESGVQPA